MTETSAETATDDADPGLSFEVEIHPERVEPGSEVVLTAVVPAEQAADLAGAFVVFFDASGDEVGRGALTDSFSGSRRSEPVELIAPERPGPHHWSALLVLPVADAGEVLGETAFDVVVSAHPIALTVWDAPRAVERSAIFQVKLGIKCPCGCDSAGWAWRITDEAGEEVAAGTVGEAVWQGTTGLHFSEVELTAPDELGARNWSVTALPPDHEIEHAEKSLPLRVDVRAAADATLLVEVFDAATGKPVERAKVTAHPYRAFTDAEGRAVLRVSGGRYTVFVSGKGYFAVRRSVEVVEDLTLRADMYIDRELTHADAWG